MFWYFKHKTLIFEIILKWRYFDCEIKTTSRWQQVSVNKWVITIESNHLKIDSFRNESLSCCSETQNSAGAVWNYFFVGEMEQKQAIWCLKHKFLNINLLFIELLYKINIIFVIMLIFEEKNGTLSVILTIWNDIYTFSAPISWFLWSILMHFIRLNHAVKEHTRV